MRILNKTFLNNYSITLKQENHFKPLTSDQVLNIDETVGGHNYHKKIYGDDTYKLIVSKGIKISERSYYEAVFSLMADNTAREIRKIIKKKDISVLELCTGSGSQTYAFLKANYNVFTVEKNKQILKWTKENFKKMQISGNILFYNGLLEEFFEKNSFSRKTHQFNKKIDMIYADPPWGGNYYTSFKSYFLWEHIVPDGRIIISEMIDKIPIICLKLPTTMPIEVISDFSKEKKLDVHIINQEIIVGDRKLEERIVFFNRSKTDHSFIKIRNNKL